MIEMPEPGDVAEIDVPGGLAYFQFTHQHPTYGSLIRVLPGIHRERASGLEGLVAGRHRFQVFFPLRDACRQGIVRIVGRFPIPEACLAFPTFRAGVPDRETRKVGDNWWLWNGQDEWRVGALTPDQRAYPIRGVVNDTLLRERIASEWSPADEE